MDANSFPTELMLHEPNRREKLLQQYYETHHEEKDVESVKDHQKKLTFFQDCLRRDKVSVELGLDLGCRGGTLTNDLREFGHWVGVDIDRNALKLAAEKGIPCTELDISTSIDLQDESFDAVCMTEVLEHLAFPELTFGEIHRVLKKNKDCVFFGTVPLDYHLHRRFAVIRGKRLTNTAVHLHSFSYEELKGLLENYFEHVEFEPLRGTKRRMRWLSWKHFVRDIAWYARGPKTLPQKAAA